MRGYTVHMYLLYIDPVHILYSKIVTCFLWEVYLHYATEVIPLFP